MPWNSISVPFATRVQIPDTKKQSSPRVTELYRQIYLPVISFSGIETLLNTSRSYKMQFTWNDGKSSVPLCHEMQLWGKTIMMGPWEQLTVTAGNITTSTYSLQPCCFSILLDFGCSTSRDVLFLGGGVWGAGQERHSRAGINRTKKHAGSPCNSVWCLLVYISSAELLQHRSQPFPEHLAQS